VSPRVAAATAARVIRQLRHDPRTVALVLIVPAVLVTLVKYVFQGSPVFDRIGGPLLGVFPLITMFLVTLLGLFVSAFARTEFQAGQFLPAFIFPQLLLCGLLAPRDHMARALELVSWALPLTYAYDALDRTVHAVYGARLAVDVAVVLALAGIALGAGAATLRRRTA
jgi:ABC-2 type transport system permease protein